MMKINETLRQLRLDRDMTQEDVAEQVGLTRQAVSAYESGRTQPGLDILQRLADVYQVELTDIIYGRGRSVRLYHSMKITAIVMACVFLAAQFVCSLLIWIANRVFPLVPGGIVDGGWIGRAQLIDAWNALEGIYFGLFPMCCVALLVLTFCQRRPLTVKVKALSVLGFAAASMVVVLPWALTDSYYPLTYYLTTPGRCLLELLFFFAVSVVVDLFRSRKAETGSECVYTGKPWYRRWWIWVLAVAAVLIMVAVPVLHAHYGAGANVPPVDDPGITLNGVDYPKDPTIQDFVDRGWWRGKGTDKSGIYSEETGVTGLVTTGYRMSSGESEISVSLDANELRGGAEINDCPMVGMSFYADKVVSFALGGTELTGLTLSNVREVLGEPKKESEFNGLYSYDYSMTEWGINSFTLDFPAATGKLLKINLSFV